MAKKREINRDREKNLKKKIEKEIEKEIEEVENEVKQEVERRLHERIYHGTVGSAKQFKKNFKEQMMVGITAAFAFLIALSWREPIQGSVNLMIENLGLVGKEIYINYLSALLITIIAVLALMVVSRWKSKEE